MLDVRTLLKNIPGMIRLAKFLGIFNEISHLADYEKACRIVRFNNRNTRWKP